MRKGAVWIQEKILQCRFARDRAEWSAAKGK